MTSGHCRLQSAAVCCMLCWVVAMSPHNSVPPLSAHYPCLLIAHLEYNYNPCTVSTLHSSVPWHQVDMAMLYYYFLLRSCSGPDPEYEIQITLSLRNPDSRLPRSPAGRCAGTPVSLIGPRRGRGPGRGQTGAGGWTLDILSSAQ